MDKSVEEIRKIVINIFPKLALDKDFKITSKATPDYNCIAWAFNYEDRWMQPPYLGKPNLDSVVWWPPEVPEGMEIDCLIKAFEKDGYVLCDTFEHEEGFRKVALYVDEEKQKWTHAAREKRDTTWTSKLGTNVDIQHGTPYTIENDDYGTVHCFMKKECEEKTQIKQCKKRPKSKRKIKK